MFYQSLGFSCSIFNEEVLMVEMNKSRIFYIREPGTMFIVVDPSQKDNWFPTDIVPVLYPCWGELFVNKKKIKFKIENQLILFRN